MDNGPLRENVITDIEDASCGLRTIGKALMESLQKLALWVGVMEVIQPF